MTARGWSSMDELLARFAPLFTAELAAVSLVAEYGAEFAAIRRGPDGPELVGLFPTEEAAQAAADAVQ